MSDGRLSSERCAAARPSRRLPAQVGRPWRVIGVISGWEPRSSSSALDLASRFFLGTLAGYTPASPLGEGARPITEAARPWAIPLVVGLGGLISGIIVFRFAPEAEGHGTDAAIAAFHHAARRIRGRIPLVKLVASAITIGSGGSGGRERARRRRSAPGFGSFLARLLDLDARDARIAVSTGMGAGIGAIFRAPLGGAVLAVEIPYREDVEADALVPAFVGSIVAFSIFGIDRRVLADLRPGLGRRLHRSAPARLLLADRPRGGLRRPPLHRQLLRPYRAGSRAGRSRASRARRSAGLRRRLPRRSLLPGVLGTGYGWVQAGLDRTTLLGLPLWVVLALPFAKILATSLSIGSGGSGGMFGPGHGHRRAARRGHLAAARADRAGRAGRPGALRRSWR